MGEKKAARSGSGQRGGGGGRTAGHRNCLAGGLANLDQRPAVSTFCFCCCALESAAGIMRQAGTLKLSAIDAKYLTPARGAVPELAG